MGLARFPAFALSAIIALGALLRLAIGAAILRLFVTLARTARAPMPAVRRGRAEGAFGEIERSVNGMTDFLANLTRTQGELVAAVRRGVCVCARCCCVPTAGRSCSRTASRLSSPSTRPERLISVNVSHSLTDSATPWWLMCAILEKLFGRTRSRRFIRIPANGLLGPWLDLWRC